MSDDQPARRDPFLPLIALVTVLGAVVRVKVAATEPPHFDESYTAVHYVLESAKTIASTYDEPNNHILHSLLAWLSTGLFGSGPFALRLPALLAGIALVPATGLLARATVRHARRGEVSRTTGAHEAQATGATEATGPDDARAVTTISYGGGGVAGLVAAGIGAAAPPLIAYSANARGYTIVLLLMVAQLGLTLRLAASVDRLMLHAETTDEAAALHSPGRLWVVWAAWVLCGALAIWTVPTAVLGVAVAAIWLVALRSGPARRLLAPIAAVAATGVSALALYSPVLGQRGFTVDRFTAAPVHELATTLTHAWAAGLAAPLIAVAVALALFGLARRPQLGPSATLAIGLLALPVAIAALGRVLPYSRTYLFLLPILAVLAGIGAARLLPQLERRGRVVARGSAVALTLLAVLAGATAQTREAWGEDPPGPSRGDLAATFERSLRSQIVVPPGTPLSKLGRLVAPPFDLPQVQYAFTLGLGEANGFEPVRPAEARRELGPRPAGAQVLTVLTHEGVTPTAALAALRLDPASYETVSWSHGDAQLIVAHPR